MTKQTHFFGFQFHNTPATTIGQPNKRTGNHSIAGDFIVFPTYRDLYHWLTFDDTDFDRSKRIRVTKKDLRKLCSGMPYDYFHSHLVNIQCNHNGILFPSL
jgi:hypothetical protein